MDAFSAADSPAPNSLGGDRGHLAIRCDGLHSKMNAQRSEAWLTLQEKFFDQIAQPPLNPCQQPGWLLIVRRHGREVRGQARMAGGDRSAVPPGLPTSIDRNATFLSPSGLAAKR